MTGLPKDSNELIEQIKTNVRNQVLDPGRIREQCQSAKLIFRPGTAIHQLAQSAEQMLDLLQCPECRTIGSVRCLSCQGYE